MKNKISSGLLTLFLGLAITSILPVQTRYFGCTPGYWKNHLESWPTEYDPDDSVNVIFGIQLTPDVTLLEALKLHGGKGVDGAIRILMRAAVAGLLNQATLGTTGWQPGGIFHEGYMYYEDEIIDGVNAAINSGDRQTILDLAELLDIANNASCLDN